jgi:hypothetical protein
MPNGALRQIMEWPVERAAPDARPFLAPRVDGDENLLRGLDLLLKEAA